MKLRRINLKWILSIMLVMSTLAFQDPPKLKDSDTTSIIKAAYIYNFAKLIDWPSENKSGNFIIGVYGNTTVLPGVDQKNTLSKTDRHPGYRDQKNYRKAQR